MEVKYNIEKIIKSKYFKVAVAIYAAIFVYNAALTLIYPERYRAGANYTNKFKLEADAGEDGINPIMFKDKNLERVIRIYLGKDQGIIFAKDVRGITELDLRYQGITTLIDLRYFKGLKKINVAYNEISSLEGLTNLPKLEELIAFENNISDIKGIGNVKTLKKLDLANNNITDVSEISSLKNLEILNLSSNRIQNILGFEKLINLKEIDVSQNNIKDFSAVEKLKVKLLLDWGNK
ncbi:Internalin-A precursor [Caloramator mitchellensis]|uniref:Internalin-A n=1 Tax=Caloramator mitchellensis TaxID=908809 RepID=A0A0R3K1N6_CALMK|nr:leucine-rich repeat domain-containing protein [Caloramator mitchellensis]KRQ87438.1 Internalin-A precursor [Caloramator mitchellensis]